MCKFRDLRANEIDVRVARVGKTGNGVQLLLYKDARVDLDILDSTVGPENWQSKFYEVKGIMFCSVGIKCGDEWIWKDDAGSESNQDAEKGNASDARKRAGFAWGIGRELYTSPFIWVTADKCNITDGKDRKECNDKFSVKSIEITDKKITQLTIYNATAKRICYEYGKHNDEPKDDNIEAFIDAHKTFTLEEARNYVLKTTAFAGKTLETVYKDAVGRTLIADIYSNTKDVELKKAIEVVQKAIAEKKNEADRKDN